MGDWVEDGQQDCWKPGHRAEVRDPKHVQRVAGSLQS